MDQIVHDIEEEQVENILVSKTNSGSCFAYVGSRIASN
jgi:hypothetical protein